MDALKALTHRYVRDESADPTVTADDVAHYLGGVDNLPDDVTLIQLISAKSEWTLPLEIRAILQSIDECAELIFKLVELEAEIETQLRSVIPILAAKMIADPALPLSKQTTILTVLDALAAGLVGWNPELGLAGKKLIDKLEDSLTVIKSGEDNLQPLLDDINTFLEKEASRAAKLEQRLAATETGIVRSQQAKNLSSNMINQLGEGKMVTDGLQDFLAGPWQDSVQLLVNHHGLESEEWKRAGKITETIFWTYQPTENGSVSAIDKEKMYRIIEHLPDEIRELLIALQHNTEAAGSAIRTIESDSVAIVSGLSLELMEFEPLSCDLPATTGSTVSKRLVAKVQAMQTGQWFTYQDQDKSARIKLVLKIDDVRQLLFTNRNGMKVMQKSFDEFAYYLSSHTVNPLSHQNVFSSTFNTFYKDLIDEFTDYQRQINDREAEVKRLDEEREVARKKALLEADRLARDQEEAEKHKLESEKAERLARAKAEAEKSENQGLVEEFSQKVADLNTGAFLRLPGPDGQLNDCKLAVKITAADKLIFVSRSGAKVGEYSHRQLVQLLVSGQGEISNSGVEFEDTLARVVKKLRQDRTKSYDDLTGS